MSSRASLSILAPPDQGPSARSPELNDNQKQEEIHLRKVLNSPTFSRAPRLARLLSYLCAKRVAGESDELKEYTIAVEFLGRPVDFQCKEDASIRVDMRRLRRQLERYYRSDGKRDEMVLSIPSGQYVPLFERKPEAAPQPQEGASARDAGGPATPRPLKRRFSWLLLAAGLCLGVMLSQVLERVPFDSFTLADSRTNETTFASGATAPPAVPTGPEIRILAGARPLQYADKFGATWNGDAFFAGGTPLTYPEACAALPQDDGLWRNVREGDFEYRIPLSAGIYELHLYFVEMVYGTEDEGGGEGSREFCVFANGRHILTRFDIVADAGGSRIPDIKVFTDVSPAPDGFLHLRFESKKSKALVSRIEILPGIVGRMRPLRIACRGGSYTDGDGVSWSADRFFRGGRLAIRVAEANRYPGIYCSERWGHFRYTVPVAPGRYTVRLHFFEGDRSVFNAGMAHPGPRLFDVFCNGEAILREFNIEKETGDPSRPLARTFRGVKANAQGKILLDFVPIKNYACLNALEILPE